MQKPYEPPKQEHDLICPNCGSSDISQDLKHTVKNSNNQELKQYSCGSCHANFIPAMDGTPSNNKSVDKWAMKMRQKEGMNENKTWSKPKKDFIIILPVDDSK